MTARLICLENNEMVSLEKIEIETEYEDVDIDTFIAANQSRLDAQRDQIAHLETELAARSSALDVLKDKHNRFTGMIMSAMSDEIKVLISGEVSEQLSNALHLDWDASDHRTEIMDIVNDDFDIDDHQYGVESIIDTHFCFDNYSDELNDMIRDYINDCTVTIETP